MARYLTYVINPITYLATTPCPHGRTIESKTIMVASNACQMCSYFVKFGKQHDDGGKLYCRYSKRGVR